MWGDKKENDRARKNATVVMASTARTQMNERESTKTASKKMKQKIRLVFVRSFAQTTATTSTATYKQTKKAAAANSIDLCVGRQGAYVQISLHA